MKVGSMMPASLCKDFLRGELDELTLGPLRHPLGDEEPVTLLEFPVVDHILPVFCRLFVLVPQGLHLNLLHAVVSPRAIMGTKRM